MEFDPESFMNDVHAALQHHSPYSRGAVRPREQHDGGNGELDSIVEEGRGSMFPASKRRRLSTNIESTSPESFDISEWLTTENEALSADTHDGSDSESDDDVPAFFSPSLDMTTALVSSHPRIPPAIPANTWELQERGSSDASLMYAERLDLVPNFYAYSVKACLLPIRRVQHALVSLYFHHIHPMFPVVDEYRMTELHQKYRGQEELMDPSDFTVYHAIMVAGFAHLSEAQVCNTPYRSVLEGQEAQVEQLKARYWSQPTADPVVLTQICLLLSLWSPGWIGAQNNSYWLDMAFKHATMGRLWESQPSALPSIKGRKCRKRLLWWCCLIRDRVLALGMRRPHRLHKTPIQDEIISEEDFGLEASYPSYTDVKSKRVAMVAFVWFCRLSRIMEAIAVAQRRNRFARDWNRDNVGNVTSELEEVRLFDSRLREWLVEFEEEVGGCRMDKDQPVPVPISTLRIIAHSLQAGLYQPYLHLSVDHPALVEAGIDPLERMKDGAREVAISVRDVMTNKKSDAIPTWLVAWVTLPVAVYHVNQRIRLNSSPDQILMPFLAQLVRRSSGAQMLLMTVRSATKDHIEQIAKAEDEKDPHVAAAPKGQSSFHFVHSGLSPNVITRSTEAKTLAFVTKAIDSALELNGSSPEEN